MAFRKGFSLIEIMIVVVVLGILAAVAIPRFAGATADARSTATQSVLASARASIAAYRTGAIIAGSEPFPNIAQMTDGSVIRSELPANPFTGVIGIQSVGRAQAEARSVANPHAAGWNYFFDNNAVPPFAVFYANSQDPTTLRNADGNPINANEL
jgi:prepilin-type N-terminal cleavage/methylation domain-containing protein